MHEGGARAIHAWGQHVQCAHGGCMHNAHVGGTHNACMEGACTMHAWGCTRNVRMAGAHTRCNAWRCVEGCASFFVLGYHCLPLATIDLVGDNREFEV